MSHKKLEDYNPYTHTERKRERETQKKTLYICTLKNKPTNIKRKTKMFIDYLDNLRSKAVSNDGSLVGVIRVSFVVIHHVGRFIPQPFIDKSFCCC